MLKENLSCKRRKSLVTLREKCGKNTDVVECDHLSSRKSLRLQGPSGILLSPEILKTSESSSENFGENPGYEQTAKVRRIRTLQSNRAVFSRAKFTLFCFVLT